MKASSTPETTHEHGRFSFALPDTELVLACTSRPILKASATTSPVMETRSSVFSLQLTATLASRPKQLLEIQEDDCCGYAEFVSLM